MTWQHELKRAARYEQMHNRDSAGKPCQWRNAAEMHRAMAAKLLREYVKPIKPVMLYDSEA